MAEREDTVRKVFMLPTELMDRVNEYKTDHGIDSEAEAVRRLLDTALLFRDTTRSIIIKMLTRSRTEGDIRVIARDVLATHPLVESIAYYPTEVHFTVRNDFPGIFTKDGKGRFTRPDKTTVDFFYNREGKLTEMDDDIPF